MIGRISGRIIEKQPPLLVLDINGLGYEVLASMQTFYQLPELEAQTTLFTHLLIREDAHTLYGFINSRERDFFRHLIRINGVGPKLALAILSGISVTELVQVVQNNDTSRLIRIPGIGKKTAERLMIEMRDKIRQWQCETTTQTPMSAQEQQNGQPDISVADVRTSYQEAMSALLNLGYKEAVARKMLAIDDAANMSAEALIKQALRNSLAS